ncbi:hypothetical protein AOLI_G00052980 [Acnodon oligacanthus]
MSCMQAQCTNRHIRMCGSLGLNVVSLVIYEESGLSTMWLSSSMTDNSGDVNGNLAFVFSYVPS